MKQETIRVILDVSKREQAVHLSARCIYHGVSYNNRRQLCLYVEVDVDATFMERNIYIFGTNEEAHVKDLIFIGSVESNFAGMSHVYGERGAM